jgi:hypothetical protein
VLEEIEGVVNVPPVKSNVPPVAALYQYIGKADVAVRIIDPVPHLDESFTRGVGGNGTTIAWTAILVLRQLPFDDSR